MAHGAEQREQHWQAVRALFDRLVDAPPAQRDAVLARTDASGEIVREVRSLLRAADASEGFLTEPASASAAGDLGQALNYRSVSEGTRIGAFRVEALIGRGGHGEVYRARRDDGEFDQIVALKLLRPEAAAQFDRFKTERQILADVAHPGIARLIDGGTAPDGRPFIAMEFVEGLDLTRYCESRQLGLEERIRLFCEVCSAVAYAHRSLVVHRDLKPSNILVTPEGATKLLDFGVASIASDGSGQTLTEVILTPDYAAPEQFEGRRATTATDVYALGAVLFELLTGRPPWRMEGGPLAGALRLLQDEPPRASKVAATMASPPVASQRLRGDLDAILAKALRQEPEARYDTASALADDLGRHLAFLPVRARSGDLAYRAHRFARRNRGRLAAAAVVAVAVSLGGAGIAWQAREAAAERDAARLETARAAAVHDFVLLMLRTAGEAGGPSFTTAKQILDQTAARLQGEQAGAGPSYLAQLRTLGELYAELDDVSGAAPLLQRFVALSRDGGDVVAAGRAQQILAAVEVRRGNLEDARLNLDEAAAVWRSDGRRFAREQAEGAGVEAGLLRESGRRDEAIARLQEAIRRSTALLGENSRELATLHHNLGVHFLESGRLAESDAALAQAWRLLIAQGRTASTIGTAVLGHRAGLAYRQGDVATAERLWREAIAARRALYGPSLATAAWQLNLGRALLLQNRRDEAHAVLSEGLDIATAFGGETSSITLLFRQSHALSLLLLGRGAEADAQIGRALVQSERAFGAGHVYHALGLVTRARLHWQQGRDASALADLDAADHVLAQAGDAGALHRAESVALRGLIRQGGVPLGSPVKR